MTLHLVLGGARSGKSAYAQGAAATAAQGRALVYVATAEGLDEEMRARIARHQADRGPEWRLLEAPLELGAALEGLDPEASVLVDCLTLWLSNSRFGAPEGHERRAMALKAALGRRRGPTFLVGNEVGFGVVPDNALARAFRDEAGRLHQELAAQADEVVLVVAGLPLKLKG